VLTTRIALPVTAALLVLAPASAQALPTFTTDRTCYAAEWDIITFDGQGFTASAEIALLFAHNGQVGSFSTKADPAGVFRAQLRAPSLDDFEEERAFELSVTANDQSKFGPDGPIGPPEEGVAFGQVRISERMVGVRAWDADGPATARGGQRLKLSATAWRGEGDALYIHYMRGRRAVRSEKLGTLTGACGDLRATFRAIARPGTYGVRFSTSPRWSARDAWMGYRRVRIV